MLRELTRLEDTCAEEKERLRDEHSFPSRMPRLNDDFDDVVVLAVSCIEYMHSDEKPMEFAIDGRKCMDTDQSLALQSF